MTSYSSIYITIHATFSWLALYISTHINNPMYTNDIYSVFYVRCLYIYIYIYMCVCVTPVFMSMLALPRGQGLRARLNQEGGNANIEEEKVCNINVFTLLSTCSLGSISNRSTFCLIDCLHICLSWIESPDDVHIQQ